MAQNRHKYSWQLLLVSCLAITSSLNDLALAQNLITPDQTLRNESSLVDSFDSLSDLITGGAVRGTNLFHSFLEFNVADGKIAYFVNPSNSIQNIIARVTGRNISNIQGIIATINDDFTTPKANLFLINPNGIIFGPNAFISIGGSFFATTAMREKIVSHKIQQNSDIWGGALAYGITHAMFFMLSYLFTPPIAVRILAQMRLNLYPLPQVRL